MCFFLLANPKKRRYQHLYEDDNLRPRKRRVTTSSPRSVGYQPLRGQGVKRDPPMMVESRHSSASPQATPLRGHGAKRDPPKREMVQTEVSPPKPKPERRHHHERRPSTSSKQSARRHSEQRQTRSSSRRHVHFADPPSSTVNSYANYPAVRQSQWTTSATPQVWPHYQQQTSQQYASYPSGYGYSYHVPQPVENTAIRAATNQALQQIDQGSTRPRRLRRQAAYCDLNYYNSSW